MQVFDIMALSSRAVSDIKRALDYAADQEWSLKLIVREFVTIPLEGEYRGFVHNRQLNALSQYYADAYFWRLPLQRDDISRRVLAFFESMKASITLDSYIIDFAVTDDKVCIVELNPFTEQTGSCLFDWKKDKHIIENGPFELRVNMSPVRGVDAGLIPWKSLLDPAVKELQGNSGTTNTPATKDGKNGKCTIM
jgi:hypothetical protein